MTLYEELKARGLVAQITDDEIIDVINNGKATFYIGFDCTADSLTAALEHARDTAEKEKKLRMPSPAPVSLDTFRDRLFLQLYGGLFTDRAVFDRQCAELGVTFKAPRHIVAVGSLQTPDLPTSQLVTLSTGVTRMAAETLPKYRPCRVTAMDLRHFSVLLPLPVLLLRSLLLLHHIHCHLL